MAPDLSRKAQLYLHFHIFCKRQSPTSVKFVHMKAMQKVIVAVFETKGRSNLGAECSEPKLQKGIVSDCTTLPPQLF